jgi:predicted DNA-binding transcriptional regulator AlpA
VSGNAFDPLKVYSLRQVCELLDISFDTLKRLEAAGEAPERVQLSPNRVGCTGRAIAAWQDARRSPANCSAAAGTGGGVMGRHKKKWRNGDWVNFQLGYHAGLKEWGWVCAQYDGGEIHAGFATKEEAERDAVLTVLGPDVEIKEAGFLRDAPKQMQ